MRVVALGAVVALLCAVSHICAAEGESQIPTTQEKTNLTPSDTKAVEPPNHAAGADSESGSESDHSAEEHHKAKRSIEGLEGELSPIGAEGENRQESLDRERRIRILPGFLG